MTEPVAVRVVVEQLRDLGVQPGDVVLVHSSYRAIRPVEGGPDGANDALVDAVGPKGTVVMPSWTDDDDEVFDPSEDDVIEHLGVIADTFWRRDGVVRGDHPFAVAAYGAKADEIAGAPFILPPHAAGSGVARVHDADGKVLLLGVDHSENSTIHFAELCAGVPYRKRLHITIEENGEPKRIDYDENDHCCERFRMAGPWLRNRGLLRVGRFGHGYAMLARSRDIVATVVEELHGDLCRFLHEPGVCVDCDAARAGIGEAV